MFLICGGQIRENSQGKDLGGFGGYLGGIWENPSLAKKTNEKTMKNQQKTRKSKKLKKNWF